MYKIVDTIILEFGAEGSNEFEKLIEFKQDGTDVWASMHLLEKMKVEPKIEKKALDIIREEAQNSIGMDYWLKEYIAKK